MKVARFYGAKDIRVEDAPEPQPGRGQVKLKIAWAGICGSDLHEYLGGPIFCPKSPHPTTGEQVPITMGHEFSGTIVGVGEGVDSIKFPIGANAVIEPILHCTRPECPACKSGTRNNCDQLGIIGLTGGGGGLSGYIAVSTPYVHIIPSNIPLDVAACVEPLAVAWYAVKRANFKPGNTCLILGSGPIGLFILKVIKSLGCGWVGVSEPTKARREKGLQHGADVSVDPLSVDVVSVVRGHTQGLGVDIAFECAGLQASLDVAIAATRLRGTIMNVALWWGSSPRVDMTGMLMGEKTLATSCIYSGVHAEVIAAIASGRLAGLEDLITSKIGIEDVVEKGFEALVHDKDNQVKILVHPGHA